MFSRKRCTFVLCLVVFHASRFTKADRSVKKEMVYSVVRDIHGNALCATDEPNQILTARSKLSCFVACQDKPKCWAANWKLPNSCEHYSYNPRGYQVEIGCTFMIPVVEDCTLVKGFDGLYPVMISQQTVTVYCDLSSPGGGWLVFQKRVDGSVNFYRNWNSYRQGFGNISHEFWLGLDLLHKWTSTKPYKLRIDLGDFNGERRFAEYSSFTVDSLATNYTLNIGTYTDGTAGDSMTCPEYSSWSSAQGMQFSTFDAKHDVSTQYYCAVDFKGAWWYRACHTGNLNGAYLGGSHSSFADGVEWSTWTGFYYSLQFTEMKITAID